jgi:Holliday junction DNA helicase RuvB
VTIDKSGCKKISDCSRKTPRIANRILKRVRDFAQINDIKNIDSAISTKALEMLEIDKLGLEPADREIIKIMIDKFNGGPVGVQTIAAAASEEIQTIEDVYEPFLIQCGLLDRTSRGRVVTEKGYTHLGYTFNKDAVEIKF